MARLDVLKAVHVVYAKWCPHCVPTTVEPLKRATQELGVPLVLHDIDTVDVQVADEMVRKYGDWTPDYLVPQVFLESDDGKLEHVLTGNPRGLSLTKQAVDALIQGRLKSAPRA